MGKIAEVDFGGGVAPVDQVEEIVMKHMTKKQEEVPREKLYCEVENNIWLVIACGAMFMCAALLLAFCIRELITWIVLALA